jgi:hypothetical protein
MAILYRLPSGTPVYGPPYTLREQLEINKWMSAAPVAIHYGHARRETGKAPEPVEPKPTKGRGPRGKAKG